MQYLSPDKLGSIVSTFLPLRPNRQSCISRRNHVCMIQYGHLKMTKMCRIFVPLLLASTKFRKILRKYRNSAATGKFRGSAHNSACRGKLWSLLISIYLVLSQTPAYIARPQPVHWTVCMKSLLSDGADFYWLDFALLTAKRFNISEITVVKCCKYFL